MNAIIGNKDEEYEETTELFRGMRTALFIVVSVTLMAGCLGGHRCHSIPPSENPAELGFSHFAPP